MLWFWSALSTSILWGFSYSVSGHVLKKGISIFTLMFLSACMALPLFGFLSWRDGSLASALKSLKGSPPLSSWLVALILCNLMGSTLIYFAVREKNATSAAFIEISYPLFVALCAWLIFGENQLTLPIVIGGLLVLSGIGVMYLGK